MPLTYFKLTALGLFAVICFGSGVWTRDRLSPPIDQAKCYALFLDR
jgi:hypothetical protein